MKFLDYITESEKELNEDYENFENLYEDLGTLKVLPPEVLKALKGDYNGQNFMGDASKITTVNLTSNGKKLNPTINKIVKDGEDILMGNYYVFLYIEGENFETGEKEPLGFYKRTIDERKWGTVRVGTNWKAELIGSFNPDRKDLQTSINDYDGIVTGYIVGPDVARAEKAQERRMERALGDKNFNYSGGFKHKTKDVQKLVGDKLDKKFKVHRKTVEENFKKALELFDTINITDTDVYSKKSKIKELLDSSNKTVEKVSDLSYEARKLFSERETLDMYDVKKIFALVRDIED